MRAQTSICHLLQMHTSLGLSLADWSCLTQLGLCPLSWRLPGTVLAPSPLPQDTATSIGQSDSRAPPGIGLDLHTIESWFLLSCLMVIAANWPSVYLLHETLRPRTCVGKLKPKTPADTVGFLLLKTTTGKASRTLQLHPLTVSSRQQRLQSLPHLLFALVFLSLPSAELSIREHGLTIRGALSLQFQPCAAPILPVPPHPQLRPALHSSASGVFASMPVLSYPNGVSPVSSLAPDPRPSSCCSLKRLLWFHCFPSCLQTHSSHSELCWHPIPIRINSHDSTTQVPSYGHYKFASFCKEALPFVKHRTELWRGPEATQWLI